jgi:PAS domain S-box-containing protein
MATRVLLVDDNPQDRLLTRRALASEFPDLELTEVIGQAQLDDALDAPAFDIVVTDFQIRWTDGLKVLEAVQGIAPEIPVIMFTNTGSEEIAASAFRMHLTDYIVKAPGHYIRLAHGVRVALKNAAERREMGATLQQQGRLIDLSQEPIFAWDLDSGIVQWNAGSERLYGYSRDEAIGHSPHELLRTIHPLPLAEFQRELAERGEWAGELRHQARDGREVVVESRQQLIETESHRVVLESNRDVTDRKRAADRAAFINRASTVLATSLDYETTLTSVANLAVQSIADWCAVDIVVDTKVERLAVAHVDQQKIELARTVHRHEDPTAPHSVMHVIRTKTPALVPLVTDEMLAAAAQGDEEQLRLIRSFGLVSYICVPLVAHARTLGALTFATAESRRRYTEQDLAFAQDLAYRAALAVDNAHAYNQIQIADRLKDEFLATLSHELRTPLNAILGYARLLQNGTVTREKVPKAVEIVERNASALAQMVEDVLDVSRIISGKMRLTIQPVDLPMVVQHAVESVAPAADAKQLRVQTSIDPDAGPISGDPDRLQQIAWNLISNAVKFTPKGGRVQVRVERVDSHVDIVVSDTGVGIKAEFLPHLFERFRQADSATTRQFGGLGLGLAIVRHLVELHGGSVAASSGGEGKGSTFRVHLPLMIVHHHSAVDERRKHARTKTPSPVGTAAPKLDGVHVLAVDDDRDALSLLTEVLELAGARVTTLDSAIRGLDQLPTLRPDVLIADIGLPDLDGFEMIRRVRSHTDSVLRDTPAIALTAYARSEDRVRALESGFQMHIGKPADPAELVAAIAAFVKRSRPW